MRAQGWEHLHRTAGYLWFCQFLLWAVQGTGCDKVFWHEDSPCSRPADYLCRTSYKKFLKGIGVWSDTKQEAVNCYRGNWMWQGVTVGEELYCQGLLCLGGMMCAGNAKLALKLFFFTVGLSYLRCSPDFEKGKGTSGFQIVHEPHKRCWRNCMAVDPRRCPCEVWHIKTPSGLCRTSGFAFGLLATLKTSFYSIY